MNLIKVYDALLAGNGNFTTAEVARKVGISPSQASKILTKMSGLGKVLRVCRGKWTLLAKTNRLQLPEFVASTDTYCTAHTALFHHGMIEQIPTTIHAATAGRSKKAKTPFGPIQIHQISPAMFQGWKRKESGAKIASPEKALVDYFYLGISGNPQFKTLPEVEIPNGFSWEKAKRFTQNIPNKAWRTIVQEKLRKQKTTCDALAQEDSAEK